MREHCFHNEHHPFPFQSADFTLHGGNARCNAQLFSAHDTPPCGHYPHFLVSGHSVEMSVTQSIAALLPTCSIGLEVTITCVSCPVRKIALSARSDWPPCGQEHVFFVGDSVLRWQPAFEMSFIGVSKKLGSRFDPRQPWIPFLVPQMIVTRGVQVLLQSRLQ